MKKKREQLNEELEELLKEIEKRSKADTEIKDIAQTFCSAVAEAVDDIPGIDIIAMCFNKDMTGLMLKNATHDKDDSAYIRAYAITELLRTFLKYDFKDIHKDIFGHDFEESGLDKTEIESLMMALVKVCMLLKEYKKDDDNE